MADKEKYEYQILDISSNVVKTSEQRKALLETLYADGWEWTDFTVRRLAILRRKKE